MLNRRNFFKFAGASATAFALAACGNSSANKTDDAASSAAADATASAADDSASSTAEAEPVAVRAAALKGPTAMGLVRFMSEADAGNIADNDYSFSIVASSDEVAPLVSKAEADVICAPANLAAVLYNKTEGGVKVAAINTLGVLYICEQGETVQTVADLAGKTIYASGKGATPEYALNYILEQNGLDPAADVTIEWKSEHSECVAALAENAAGIAMLPQPFVTTAQMQNDVIRVALDLTEEWDAIQAANGGSSTLITGVAMVRTEFADENPAAVDAFLEHYADSVEWVNANTEDAAQLIEDYDIVKAAVATKALPECNIVCITGDDMVEKLGGYLEVLFYANTESVGGALPGDDFYYGA